MVNHGDETHVTSVRVFKANQISSSEQKEEGLFLFHVTRKIAMLITRNGLIEEIITAEHVRKKSLTFNLNNLYCKEYIQRLSKLAVSKSALFLPVSHKILSEEISEYLNTFQFNVDTDPSLRTQRICILVQVHTLWVTKYTRSYYTAFTRPIWDTELDEGDDDDELLGNETLMDIRVGLIKEVRLRSTRVEIGEELEGFSEIFVVKVLESDEESICCPICSEGFSMEMEAAKAPNCSHLFHRKCLVKWLPKSNTCPMCRGSCIVVV